MMAALGEGDLEDGQIVCPRHGATGYSNGRRSYTAGLRAVPSSPGAVVDGDILVEAS
jgi:hypothetical protein